jgi:hypothetical protein
LALGSSEHCNRIPLSDIKRIPPDPGFFQGRTTMQHIAPVGIGAAGAPLPAQHAQPNALRNVLNAVARIRPPSHELRAAVGLVIMLTGTYGAFHGYGWNGGIMSWVGMAIYHHSLPHLRFPPGLAAGLALGAFV